MPEYKTPGVYIEEIPHLPPSIVSVGTAIPVFIGYTEKAIKKATDDLIGKNWRIKSALEYKTYFGGPPKEPDGAISVTFNNSTGTLDVLGVVDETKRSKYLLYYSLQMFFANGGGICYIQSVGTYVDGGLIDNDLLTTALEEAKKENEITLIVFPDAINIASSDNYYNLHNAAVQQCVNLQNRFVVLDVYRTTANASNLWSGDIDIARSAVAGKVGMAGDTDHLKYAAVYFPRIYTLVNYNAHETLVKITGVGIVDNKNAAVILPATMDALQGKFNSFYNLAKQAINDIEMLLPVAASIVGIYTQVDDARGVWKAPANVNIQNAVTPEVLITKEDQDTLNVDQVAGKSINAIRPFTGRGNAIVWGARTLAGNDNEWRYISVRRFFIMMEQSVKNATEQFVFEPNDENTWVRVRGMIYNYLSQQWKAGALMGASVKEAFFIHVGLGQTMTEVDIWEGRMKIEIGVAVVRPAEFIILQFSHKMLSET